MQEIKSWPTAKSLSDSEKAGEKPAHDNSAEYSKVEMPSHPIVAILEEWWVSPGIWET